MEAYGGVDVWMHVFLTSALVGDEWSASTFCVLLRFSSLKSMLFVVLMCEGLEVRNAVVMKSSVFWDTKPRGPLKVNRTTLRCIPEDRTILCEVWSKPER
jgi:hypothetical protein